MSLIVDVVDLGVMDYEEALNIQIQYHHEIEKNLRNSTLILVEHPHIYTLGIRGGLEHLKLSEEECKKKEIAIAHIRRGGDITYHGPGQLVGYPILNLRALNLKLKRYVYGLEDMMIKLLKQEYQLNAEKGEGKYTGVFVGDNKITAIGIEVKQGVTMHGFAFNVNTDLSYFDSIVPCGLIDKGVTSLKKELALNQDMNSVKQHVINAFFDEFQLKASLK